MPYAIRHHTADLALEIRADSLPGFFQLLVQAIAITYSGPGILLHSRGEPLTMDADTLERLTVNLANEVIFQFDAHARLVHNLVDIHIAKDGSKGWLFTATPLYMPIDDSMQQDGDLKAATYHGLEVKQSATGSWSATLVIDT